jgi:16S rRNA (uracil1498-N3)-methyltransferase
MHRTRLHIEGNYSTGAELELGSDKARYLTRVMRLRVGDPLLIFDGEGSEYHATLASAGKASATLSVNEKTIAGISRGDRMDFVVQKATELGIKRVTPVLTEYGVVKLDAIRAKKRRDHWQKVAASACEQCGRVRLPLIDMPVTLKGWFGSKPASVDMQLILRPGAKSSLAGIDEPPTKICLLVGPEGGFSDGEYADAEVAGFRPIALGPRIMRTETAAVATLAILQSRWGDLC